MTALERDALAWILGIPDSSDFVQEHLGTNWYHGKSENTERFADLLSIANLDELLGRFGVRHPSIKLVRSGSAVPTAEYLWRDRMVDPARVAQLFSEGATVVFGGLHDRHEPARRLCNAVSLQVSARTQTNIYLTPPGSQGFRPHWDTHDVYVLQIEGSKRWRMYGGGPELPLKDHKFDPARHQAGDVENEFTLETGEALYVPRGWMHAAATTDSTSVHITLGVMSYTWADLLADSLSELVDRNSSWRENVPLGFAADVGLDKELEEELSRRILTLSGEMDLHAVVPARAETFVEHLRPRATDYLKQVVHADEVSEESRVCWRPGVPGRIALRDGRVALISRGREVDFPSEAKTTLECLLRGEIIRAGEILDGLDWLSRRVILKALIREGWLTVTEES